jgi:signal transduction histidine kinase
MLPLLFLLFPTGAPVSPRWRPVVLSQVVALGVLAALVVTDADLTRPVPLVLTAAGAATLVVGAVVAAVGLLLRWRRSSGATRTQLRVFAVSAAAITGWYVVALLGLAVGLAMASPVDVLAVALLVVTPVCATGYAVARHHLYGVDVVVHRLTVWGIVTGLLLGAYLAAAALVAAALGEDRPPTAAAAGLAVAVAAALAPVRTRAQRLVDRAMYGMRGEPLEMLRAAGARLAVAVHPVDVAREIVHTAADSLRLSWVALELEEEGAWTRVGEVGHPASTDRVAVTIRDGDDDVGRLLAAPRRGERHVSARDARLLGDLATQAGPAVRAARMIHELSASRERLVEARESERRRLRRDLHDSLSPALSGIALSADTARRLVGGRPDQAEAQLTRIAAEARDSAEVVRRMLADLRPRALEDTGLLPALAARAAQLTRPGEFEVVVSATQDVDLLPDDVELAAYRIAVEAMTNAARHSGGTRCDVALSRSHGHLRVQVTDDGAGMGTATSTGTSTGLPTSTSTSTSTGTVAGVGLTSMSERAVAVGGRVRVRDGAADGTGGVRVLAELPLAGTAT